MTAPEFPREISANGAEVWDWAAKLSDHVQRLDKMRNLAADIARPRRCGDCFWWMKSRDCPREHNVNGQTRGPSCEGSICQKYREKASATQRRDRLRGELAGLKA